MISAEETFDDFIRLIGSNNSFSSNRTVGFDFGDNHCDLSIINNNYRHRTIFLVKVNHDISICGIGFLMNEPYLQKITNVKFLKGNEDLFFKYYLMMKLCA